MDRLTSLEVLVTIIDSGGFGRAAERLGMSPAMVSTHVARLEDRLGARLIDRSTRRFALTQEGHRFVEDSRAILDAFAQAESAVRRGARGPWGRVLVDAPGALGLRFVVPAISGFRTQYPEVAVDLSFGERSMVFRPDGFDIMVRVGEPPETQGLVIPLTTTRFVQVASPDYLARRGAPASPDQLADHDTIVYATAERPLGQRWRFWRDGHQSWMRPSGAAAFNHGDAITAAAVAGVGVAQTLEMLVAPEMASGKLVPVLPEWNQNRVQVQLYLPEDRLKRPAVKALAEFLSSQVNWEVTAQGRPS
jgi:DNA-binding transcriptional LysR family regulator